MSFMKDRTEKMGHQCDLGLMVLVRVEVVMLFSFSTLFSGIPDLAEEQMI